MSEQLKPWAEWVSQNRVVQVFSEVTDSVTQLEGFFRAKMPDEYSDVTFFGFGIGPTGVAGAAFQFSGRTADKRKYKTMVYVKLEELMKSLPETAEKAIVDASEAAKDLLEGR